MAGSGNKAIGLAARDSSGVVSLLPFTRRVVGDQDVKLKVLYCGVCYSDLSALKNLSGNQTYPAVPGHEITGVVTEVGSKVERFKVGQNVGVSCMVGSCRKCIHCAVDAENLCPNAIFTYNSVDTDGTRTYGGYSDVMVVNEHFVITWPQNFPLDVGAPLLCAGSTTYSAMKYYKLDQPHLHVGVFGLGGLGHVAVKFAKAFGMKVTVISSSTSKKTEAFERFGVDSFLLISDLDQMRSAAGTLDGVIDTVPPSHSIMPLLDLLKPHKKLVMLAGAGKEPVELPVFPMIVGRKTVCGSMISGVRETQEMIDFCAEKGILPEVEVVEVGYVNEAMKRLERSDVRYRFVIDIGNTLKHDTVITS